MDLDIIMQAISTIGFPIACCIGLFWYLNAERESHKEETAALSKALNDNTLVMQELKTMLKMILELGEDDETRES
jgi:hypothetical protein